AIIMDDAYYGFIVESRTTIDGIPTIPASCLIPLKARAHLDLWARRQAGDVHVKDRDVRKHRNDVFRLFRTLVPADRFALPRTLRRDLILFLERFPPDSEQWPAIHASINDPDLKDPEQIIMQLREIFELGDGTAELEGGR
ncbi:MAG: hypothetical protein JRG91_16175, partial [Deltaproteobacteria bacterium]|nr:hypothetical protein [Deltaproteobacteria bacterium]